MSIILASLQMHSIALLCCAPFKTGPFLFLLCIRLCDASIFPHLVDDPRFLMVMCNEEFFSLLNGFLFVEDQNILQVIKIHSTRMMIHRYNFIIRFRIGPSHFFDSIPQPRKSRVAVNTVRFPSTHMFFTRFRVFSAFIHGSAMNANPVLQCTKFLHQKAFHCIADILCRNHIFHHILRSIAKMKYAFITFIQINHLTFHIGFLRYAGSN
mmetsp:Transcript_3661/g.6145  ORF Transcript_3661/g.6145 Transcript_3661/m.6145 type:complete len:210 (+) Transcript_3661:537-1166(+)